MKIQNWPVELSSTVWISQENKDAYDVEESNGEDGAIQVAGVKHRVRAIHYDRRHAATERQRVQQLAGWQLPQL